MLKNITKILSKDNDLTKISMFSGHNSTLNNNTGQFINNKELNNICLIEYNLNSSISCLSDTILKNSTDDNNYWQELDVLENGSKKDFVFDRTDVQIVYITLFSIVFCCCFFGNLLVILVVVFSRRLRSITNFFLANLAVADLCVGIFCVMQNLITYLIDSWIFGDFLCRMYQFVHSLSYTASIFILIVICMERYFAIIHPITCKQILTTSRLRVVIIGVWIASAVYSTPKFIFSKAITMVHTGDGAEEDICIADRQMYNSELYDMINFGFLYITPLLIMTILYSRIAMTLWKSSRRLERQIALQNTSTNSPSYSYIHRRASSRYEKRKLGATESQVSMESDKTFVTTWKKQSSYQRQNNGAQSSQMSHSTINVLRARRGVIRMLIVVVLTFALCNLPYHARKLWQYWSTTYKGDSSFNALLTPLTFLVTYFNSGVNPLLYAFLSRNFRKGMRELILCSFKKSKGRSSSLRQRVTLHNHSLPTDSTHIGNHL